MFIYSVRASSIKFFLVLILALSLLLGLLVLGRAETVGASSNAISFEGIKTNEDRIKFISQFGLTVKESEKEAVEFSVPSDFDRIISGYNEIQRSQGLDLTRYKNKKVTRYTYEVTGISDSASDKIPDGEALVNLIIYKGTVIACDISSSDPESFILPLVR
jgi:hypothetical protein